MIDDADAEVYEKYADELMRFASMLVGPSSAEDVVADAVVRAFCSPAWPGVREHRPYLYRAVLHQARSMHRSNQRRLARESRARRFVTPSPEHLRTEVLDALRRLSSRQRAVVYLHYWEDLGPDAIGTILQVSTRTVQRELDAAQRRLEVLLR